MVAIKRSHITVERDRHGNRRYYFRKGHGARVRMREEPGSEEFDRRYHELVRNAQTAQPRQGQAKAGTFACLCQTYMGSAEFRALDPRTQYVRRQILDHIFAEPIVPGSTKVVADCPLAKFTSKSVRAIRDRKRDAPEAANARVKAIRAVYKWALEPGSEVEGIAANPAVGVPSLAPKRKGGFPPWEPENIAQYEQFHPVGTKARLALDLLRYTGVRRADAIRLGRQHVRNGTLSFVAHKGRNKSPVQVDLPITPALQASLDAGPVGDMVFLVTNQGKAYTHGGFGNWLRRQCKMAGIVGRSAHGVRKAAATLAAENGATVHELMAMFAWVTLKQAERYTRAADRKRLSANAAHLLSSSEGERKSLTKIPNTAK